MTKWFTILIALILISACGKSNPATGDSTNPSDNTLTVVTTLFPLKDFTEKIGGKHVQVESIFPPGVDAHTFEPTPKVMKKLAESDVFIYNGAGMEGFAEAAIKSLKNEDVLIVEATKGMDLQAFTGNEHGHEEDEHAHEDDQHESSEEAHKDDENSYSHDHGHEISNDTHPEGDNKENESTDQTHNHEDIDHHVWLDPVFAVDLAKNIKDQLSNAKPDAKEDFEKNYNQLKEDLVKLDSEFKNMSGSVERHEILVSHAAYGYWENRYGIEQISVSGLSPTNEPTQKQIKALIEEIEAHNINYILFEQNVSTKPAKMIKEQLDLDILYLHNLSVLTEKDIENDEDYFSLMYKNLETLEKALGKKLTK